MKTINTFQNPSTKMQKLTLCIPCNKASSTIWSGPPKSVSSDSPQLFEYIAISSILCTRDWASISEVVAPLLFLIPYKKKSIKIPKGNQCVLIVFSVIFLFRNTIFFQSLSFIQRVYSENVNLLALSSSIHTLFNQGLVCIILLRIPILPAIKAL